MRFPIITLATTLLICINANAQNLYCYNVTSGLSENTVKGIVQDDYGYIWLGTQDGLNVFNGHEFHSFGCSYQNGGTISTVNIMGLCLHKDGNQIWIAARDAVYLFSRKTKEFVHIESNDEITPTCFVYDTKKDLLVGAQEGIFRYDESTGRIVKIQLPVSNICNLVCDSRGVIWICSDNGLFYLLPGKSKLEKPVTTLATASVAEDHLGRIWVGMWYDGLMLYDNETHCLNKIDLAKIKEQSPLRVRNLLCNKDGTILLCTNAGLFRYSQGDGSVQRIFLGPQHYTDNVYTCIRDREEGLWIGTYFRGLFYFSPKNDSIQCFSPDNTPEEFSGSAISSFCEDNNGKIWIGAENGGLSLFDTKSKDFLKLSFPNPGTNIHALCMDGPTLYVGTFAQGLIKINTATGKTQTFTQENGLTDNHIFSLTKTPDGNIYIGTRLGCNILDPVTGTLSVIRELNGSFIYSICKNENGDLWFADYYNGLHRFSNGEWKHYTTKNSDIPSNRLIGLCSDEQNGRLWICSDGGGVFYFDSETERFVRLEKYPDGEGVPSVAYAICKDDNGSLWFSTNNGLYCHNEDGKLMHFTFTDGLQSNQFNYNSVYKSATGKLYFGGINGFNIISPHIFHQAPNSPAPIVTAGVSFRLEHNEEWVSDNTAEELDITIPRGITSFTLNIELLSYTTPNKNIFTYSIDGGDKHSTRKPFVSFVDFPYGKHTIEITAVNGKDIESTNSAILKINNLPPIALCNAAIIVYILICIGIIFSFILWYRKRKDEIMERNAYQEKIKFFTQIAHEIKTPVTLIKAPLEMVMKNKHSEDETRDLEVIHKNTARLINLVEQLLDFKKVSENGYTITLDAVQPEDVIRSVTSRFELLSLNGIVVSFEIKNKISNCMMDPEAYIKIVSNLMTNALKHTHTFIKVSLSLTGRSTDKRMLHLCVEDDGDGIPENEKDNIFNSFYQVGKINTERMGGVGLGLSLVKLLVDKHFGSVYIDQSYTGGCRMCVDIPYIEHKSAIVNQPAKHVETETEPQQEKQEINVLVIEDNCDMLDFICDAISSIYRPYRALNGKDALLLMKDTDVDIVISDISMPEMDGFELLKKIRESEMLSHIPVILLTAESSLDAKIKGLDYGCNAYIEKPFSVDQLIATINNILSNRELLRKTYLANGETENLSESHLDNEFMSRLTSVIQEKIGDVELPVSELAEFMNMSRSSLQRKVKGLTGLTPVELVRYIKLKKASELLYTGKYRVNEVCYMVGFNKPSYFTACFKSQFGISPKDYASKNK